MCGEKKVIQVDGKEYEIQKYQGEHQNEYLISEMKDGKVEGRCELFENGILRLSWMMKDGQRIGRISEYEKGKALFKEEWKSVLGEGDHRMIENSKEGLKLVIRDRNNTMIYKGEFDEELNRHGKGLEYDENGKLKYEGYWKRDELMRIVREFRGDEMIEYEDCNNVDILNRIPLYIGGYKIVNNYIWRDGDVHLLDSKNGTAVREYKLEDGRELNGTNLYDGWYVDGMNESIRCVLNGRQPEEMVERVTSGMKIEVCNSKDLNEITMDVERLVIDSLSCNDLTSLNLNRYELLKSIIIGNDCFENVNDFMIDGLNRLKLLKIGWGSFRNRKGVGRQKSNRSFSVLNCIELESIDIGGYSFNDFGNFKLNNLPKLITIKIGEVGNCSSNFCRSSFEIKGVIDINC